MTALAESHIRAQARTRAATERAIASLWQRLPAYNEADAAAFIKPAVATVTAAQRASISLTAAFIARSLGRQPPPINTGLILAALRPGTTPQDVYRRPFVTVWTDLKAGTPYDQAVTAGQARAQATAAMDVQLAMRQTLTAVGQRTDEILGYQRVPDSGACAFCRLIAGQRYTTEQLMPVHNRCGCGVDVITEGNRGDFTGNPENDLSITRDGLTAAVVEHGELGPVVVNGAHHFTAQADLV